MQSQKVVLHEKKVPGDEIKIVPLVGTRENVVIIRRTGDDTTVLHPGTPPNQGNTNGGPHGGWD